LIKLNWIGLDFKLEFTIFFNWIQNKIITCGEIEFNFNLINLHKIELNWILNQTQPISINLNPKIKNLMKSFEFEFEKHDELWWWENRERHNHVNFLCTKFFIWSFTFLCWSSGQYERIFLVFLFIFTFILFIFIYMVKGYI